MLIPLRTAASDDNGMCRTALGGGLLVLDPVSGLGFGVHDGLITHAIWPHGWTATQDGSVVTLLDAAGRVVAHTGDQLRVGGGWASQNEWEVCSTGIEIVATPAAS